MAASGPTECERRIDVRHVVDLPVTLRAYRLSPIAARLVDVSTRGAMIALASEIVVRGDEVVITMVGLEMVATVAWWTDDFCGLAFHRQLHATELAALRGGGRMRGPY